jgi:intracellular sulfur oxidation DsrE/DsrF family protein
LVVVEVNSHSVAVAREALSSEVALEAASSDRTKAVLNNKINTMITAEVEAAVGVVVASAGATMISHSATETLQSISAQTGPCVRRSISAGCPS